MSVSKRRIIVGAGVLLVCLAAVLGYRYFFRNSNRTSIEAISEESLLLLQLQDPVDFWNQLVSQGFWEEWSNIPALQNAQAMLLGLDSLAGQRGILQKFLKEKNMLVSLQPVGKDGMDWLFVLEAGDEPFLHFWSEIKANSADKFVTATRYYGDVLITEIKGKDESKVLSFARVDNLVVISFTSFLLEEAIRNLQSESILDLQEIYGDFVGFGQQQATLIITKKGIEGFGRLMGKDAAREALLGWPSELAIKMHPEFGGSEIRFKGELFSDQGFQQDHFDSGNTAWASWFDLVPKSAASFVILNLGQVSQLSTLMGGELVLNEVILGELENKLLQKGFLEGFAGTGIEIYLEQSYSDRSDRVLVFETDSAEMQSELLRDFVIGASEGLDRSTFVDFYKNQEIFLIDSDQFPSHLFRTNFPGFPNTFLTFYKGAMVMANSSSVLKRYLDEIDAGASAAIAKSDFLEGDLDKSRVRAYWELDFSNGWRGWIDFVSPAWAAFFQKYSTAVLQFDKLNLQVSNLGSSQSVTGKLTYQSSEMGKEDGPSMQEARSVAFEQPLTFGPKALRNFNDASIEFLVQDQSDKVFLITEEGEVISSKMLDGPIVSDVFQIDYYKNNKLQLLFATANSLYVMDRLGEFVPGFPVPIPNGKICCLRLVDYESDRNYRYFIADQAGEIYLLDRDGNLLEGWNPKVIPASLASCPTHFRVPGLGDRMFVIDSNGKWHVFNRRGEPEPGSPYKLGDDINADFAIREGNSASEVRLVTVSKRGEVVMVNFRGEITERTQLTRPDGESSFHLVKDPKNERYVWVVQEFNQLTVMDEGYQTLFSQRIDTDQMAFQYFNFGPGNEVFVAIDRQQEFIYLFDLAGQMISERPIPGTSSIEITIPQGKNEYAIFAIYGNQWIEYRLPL